MKLLLLLMAVHSAYSQSCTLTTPTTYTTTDASILTSIAYISTFNLKCPQQSNLYALTPTGQFLQLGQTPDNNYIVSWTEELNKATKGDHLLKIYGEEGVNLIKKGNEAKELASVVVNHPGAYSGPWLNSEHLAGLLGVMVGWIAISSKSRLLA